LSTTYELLKNTWPVCASLLSAVVFSYNMLRNSSKTFTVFLAQQNGKTF